MREFPRTPAPLLPCTPAPPAPPLPAMQFLSFSLTPENQAMLPTAFLAEVLNLDPSQIVPIPDVSPSVMGVCNWRGQILWLIDLAYLLGVGTLFAHDLHHPKHSVMVIRSQGKVLGLAVNEVGHLIDYKQSQILPAPPISNPQMQVLALCLKGQISSPEGRNFLVLDADAIVKFLGQHWH